MEFKARLLKEKDSVSVVIESENIQTVVYNSISIDIETRFQLAMAHTMCNAINKHFKGINSK